MPSDRRRFRTSKFSHSPASTDSGVTEGDRPPAILDVLASMPLEPAPKISHSPKPAKFWMRTEVYSSGGEKYARFRWGRGRENWGYCHINGGAASTKLVQGRRQAIDEAIARGDELPEILDLLRHWGAAKPGRKPF